MSKENIYAGAQGFVAWMKELKRIAKEELGWSKKAVKSIDSVASSMKEHYFDEGLTPKEAWAEEYSAAQ